MLGDNKTLKRVLFFIFFLRGVFKRDVNYRSRLTVSSSCKVYSQSRRRLAHCLRNL